MNWLSFIRSADSFENGLYLLQQAETKAITIMDSPYWSEEEEEVEQIKMILPPSVSVMDATVMFQQTEKALSLLVNFREKCDEFSCHALFAVFLCWNMHCLSLHELVIRVLKLIAQAEVEEVGTAGVLKPKVMLFEMFKDMLPLPLAKCITFPILQSD
jgi:hypothetical protein